LALIGFASYFRFGFGLALAFGGGRSCCRQLIWISFNIL
jgi:hypothetical protein